MTSIRRRREKIARHLEKVGATDNDYYIRAKAITEGKKDPIQVIAPLTQLKLLTDDLRETRGQHEIQWSGRQAHTRLLIDAHQNWPGGKPQEREDLQILKNGFFRAYMDCIFTMDDEK